MGVMKHRNENVYIVIVRCISKKNVIKKSGKNN